MRKKEQAKMTITIELDGDVADINVKGVSDGKRVIETLSSVLVDMVAIAIRHQQMDDDEEMDLVYGYTEKIEESIIKRLSNDTNNGNDMLN